MAKARRHIWYGGLTGNNATILEGDTLHVGHLPMAQMGPAYDALSKGAAIRDWLGGKALVLPVADIQAIDANNFGFWLKLGYHADGEANEVEISLSNPPPTEAARLLQEISGADDWEEESEPGLIGDALNAPVGCSVVVGLFAALGAYLASRPLPPKKGEWLDDTFNGLLHSLGPWFFIGLIAVVAVGAVLWGIRAVKRRPPAKLRLIRPRRAMSGRRAAEED